MNSCTFLFQMVIYVSPSAPRPTAGKTCAAKWPRSSMHSWSRAKGNKKYTIINGDGDDDATTAAAEINNDNIPPPSLLPQWKNKKKENLV